MGNEVSTATNRHYGKMKLADLLLIFKGSKRRATGEPFTEAELAKARGAVAGLKAYTPEYHGQTATASPANTSGTKSQPRTGKGPAAAAADTDTDTEGDDGWFKMITEASYAADAADAADAAPADLTAPRAAHPHPNPHPRAVHTAERFGDTIAPVVYLDDEGAPAMGPVKVIHRDVNGRFGFDLLAGAPEAGIKVHSVNDGSPAHLAGVAVGDLMMQIDGIVTYGMPYVDINEMLATAGDSVTVRVSLDNDASPSALTQQELENLAALKLQAYFKTLIDRKHEREGTDGNASNPAFRSSYEEETGPLELEVPKPWRPAGQGDGTGPAHSSAEDSAAAAAMRARTGSSGYGFSAAGLRATSKSIGKRGCNVARTGSPGKHAANPTSPDCSPGHTPYRSAKTVPVSPSPPPASCVLSAYASAVQESFNATSATFGREPDLMGVARRVSADGKRRVSFDLRPKFHVMPDPIATEAEAAQKILPEEGELDVAAYLSSSPADLSFRQAVSSTCAPPPPPLSCADASDDAVGANGEPLDLTSLDLDLDKKVSIEEFQLITSFLGVDQAEASAMFDEVVRRFELLHGVELSRGSTIPLKELIDALGFAIDDVDGPRAMADAVHQAIDFIAAHPASAPMAAVVVPTPAPLIPAVAAPATAVDAPASAPPPVPPAAAAAAAAAAAVSCLARGTAYLTSGRAALTTSVLSPLSCVDNAAPATAGEAPPSAPPAAPPTAAAVPSLVLLAPAAASVPSPVSPASAAAAVPPPQAAPPPCAALTAAAATMLAPKGSSTPPMAPTPPRVVALTPERFNSPVLAVADIAVDTGMSHGPHEGLPKRKPTYDTAIKEAGLTVKVSGSKVHAKLMGNYVQIEERFGGHPAFAKLGKDGSQLFYFYYLSKSWQIAKRLGSKKCSISTTSPATRPDKAKSIWYEARGPNGKAMQGHPGIACTLVTGGSPEKKKHESYGTRATHRKLHL